VDECKIFFDGTAVHYRRQKTVCEKSLQNLKQNKKQAHDDSGALDAGTGFVGSGRTYCIKSKHKRVIRAAVCYAFVKKPANCYAHFVTITFPASVPNDEKIRQEIFKRFVKNISAYRNVYNYIAVKEAGEKYKSIHYHAVLIAPFTPYKKFNNDLCQILINRCIVRC